MFGSSNMHVTLTLETSLHPVYDPGVQSSFPSQQTLEVVEFGTETSTLNAVL